MQEDLSVVSAVRVSTGRHNSPLACRGCCNDGEVYIVRAQWSLEKLRLRSVYCANRETRICLLLGKMGESICRADNFFDILVADL